MAWRCNDPWGPVAAKGALAMSGGVVRGMLGFSDRLSTPGGGDGSSIIGREVVFSLGELGFVRS
jgi:hypothetical protein